MSSGRGQISVAEMGLARILKGYWLQVPLNQREYAWTEREVGDLLDDIGKALRSGSTEHFLGSIMTIPRGKDLLEVVDGQQRLATTTIVCAALRNALASRSEHKLIVEGINGILAEVHFAEGARRGKLKLSDIDNLYFQQRVVDGDERAVAKSPSHRLIDAAARQAKARVQVLLAAAPEKEHGSIVSQWMEFLQQNAIVLLMQVPGEGNAYRMFETLNDRGLRVSQSDLVKNYLYSQAKDRMAEAHAKWTGMRAILESFEDDDITAEFLRQMMVSLYGYTEKAGVYDEVEKRVRGSTQAVGFIDVLMSGASDYAAILNPKHEKWTAYPQTIRATLDTLTVIRVKAFRPCMLSVARTFGPPEADRAFKLVTSASVRLMIAGGARSAARSGSVEEALASLARDISEYRIATAAALAAALDGIIPKDPQFQEAFSTATLSKADIARYILRQLEQVATKQPDPHYSPNSDTQQVSLEHVLPRSPGGNWPNFTDEDAEAYYKRIGNLVLLQTKGNSDLKSAPFAVKRPALAATPYELTRQVARLEEWTPETIATRQRQLAGFAVGAWPMTVTP